MTAPNCPRCDYPLLHSTYQKISIDACPVCKGALADASCLTQLVEDSHQHLQLIPEPTTSDLNHVGCGGRFIAHQVHPNHDLHIDICDHCQSVWFDYEELEYTDELKDIVIAKQGIDKPFRWFHGLFIFLSGIPLEFNARPRKFPWITVALIVINLLVFVAQVTHTVDSKSLAFYPLADKDIHWLGSLITSLFAHGGVLHILGNMYFLYVFGDNVEDVLGKWKYLLFYLVGGIFASLMFAAFNESIFGGAMGASGAIAALMGAYLVYFKQAKIAIPFPLLWFKKSWRKLSPWIMIGLFVLVDIVGVATSSTDGVAHWAHLGGFVFGFVFAKITYNKVVDNNKFLKFINQ